MVGLVWLVVAIVAIIPNHILLLFLVLLLWVFLGALLLYTKLLSAVLVLVVESWLNAGEEAVVVAAGALFMMACMGAFDLALQFLCPL